MRLDMSMKSFSSSPSHRYSSNKASNLKCNALKERRKAADKQASSTTKSSWTPLASNTKLNEKLFIERKELVCNWFEKWNDIQRKEILLSIIERCTNSQRFLIDLIVHPTIPVRKMDFSRILPRCVILYIFSFLDPRSLCRLARVSWYFKHLSEADECWMPKCARLGWWPSFQISPFEKGIWKHLFVESITDLKNERIPKGNLRFASVEAENNISDNNEQELTLKKTQRKAIQMSEEKQKKKMNSQKPRIRQLYALRSSSLQEQEHVKRKITSKKPFKIKGIRAVDGDSNIDDTKAISYGQGTFDVEDDDIRPLWATKRYVNLHCNVNEKELDPSHLFLQNIVHDDEIGDDHKGNSEIPGCSVFSARPWVIHENDSEGDGDEQ